MASADETPTAMEPFFFDPGSVLQAAFGDHEFQRSFKGRDVRIITSAVEFEGHRAYFRVRVETAPPEHEASFTFKIEVDAVG
ncbi:hypothetical protein [Amycolatopsis sp. ATCC 39116]|uniref:hypothetical protein n=1 Tax=Amycolatopsis sp. (strain ATCC 39116 / 75iv2) TaxID=385957 RepID=UPI00026258FF|nr:hypothetical protein [Amycolatopsis sp. ATCC 39116]